MRKKSISHFFDTVFWYILYTLPLFTFLISSFRSSTIVTLSECMTNFGLGVSSSSVVYTTLSELFGASGVLPLFASTDVLFFATYFINVMLLHVIVDVLLFIIRLCHKWLDDFGGVKNE